MSHETGETGKSEKGDGMKKFDAYEFIGILVPGVITLYGLGRLFPEVGQVASGSQLTIGDLGLFVILAFAAGHLVQAGGNLLEKVVWWSSDGLATDWVRKRRLNFLGQAQAQALEARVAAMFPGQPVKRIAAYSAEDWFLVTRQIYAAVRAANRSARIDSFNATYGMLRGMAAGLLVCAFSCLFSAKGTWQALVVCGALAIVAVFRMHRFGKSYARELFVQFLEVKPGEAAAPEKKE
jgi:hypothetical protein